MAERQIFQVSDLAEALRGLLEDSLPRMWVQGEISNFSRPASGHWYFTLKDSGAQIRCAMFRNANFGIRPQPKDGDQVLVRGQVTLYAARGDLQLICEHLEPAGEGALLAAFERLKKKLAAEGLFDEALKRPLPALPRHIGVITSATGAAVQDIRATLARRWPLATVWLYPVPVQGADAPPAIVRALNELPRLAPVDVVILARGGGSLEDLWAFNDEAVVRALRACAKPVVSGVGHEVDFTLADFAADLRAPTPTAAAERVTPDIADWREHLDELGESLRAAVEDGIELRGERLAQLAARLSNLHPGRRLLERNQRLDELSERLLHASGQLAARSEQRLSTLNQRLVAASPGQKLLALRSRLDHARQRLLLASQAGQQQRLYRLGSAASRLQALNPLAVLARGYALATTADGRVATEATALAPGSRLEVRLARGAVATVVQGLATVGGQPPANKSSS